LVCAVVLAVFVIVVGIFRYRRGDRWTLAALLTPPTGALLGIYASDHDELWLAVPAVALLLLGPVVRQIAVH
jgi:hypothetical protein